MQLFLLHVYVYASATIFLCVFWRGGNPQTKARFCIQKQETFFQKRTKRMHRSLPFPHFPVVLPIPGLGGTTCREREKNNFDAMPEIARWDREKVVLVWQFALLHTVFYNCLGAKKRRKEMFIWLFRVERQMRKWDTVLEPLLFIIQL